MKVWRGTVLPYPSAGMTMGPNDLGQNNLDSTQAGFFAGLRSLWEEAKSS